MATTQSKHAHPITIVYNLKRFFFLIIIPVLRGFLSALQGGLASWVKGAWMDILIVTIMVGLSVLNWWYYTYRYDSQCFYLSRGWFQKHSLCLPWRKITMISTISPFFLRPVGAVSFRADSLGGRKRQTDVKLYLTKEEADTLTATNDSLRESSTVLASYSPPFSSILLLATVSSSSFGGVIYIATFISQSGKIVGRKFQDSLIGTFEEAARKWAIQIPPAAMAIALFFILAWVVGFILTLIRYRNFKVARTSQSVKIQGGLFTLRDYTIQGANINYWDIRQNLITYLLQRHSLYVSVVGNEKEKNDISCVIPVERRVAFKNISYKLFPNIRDSSLQIKPKLGGIMRYLRDPLILLGTIPLLMLLTIFLSPSWKSFILFVGIMALLPCVFFFIVRLLDFATAGIGYRHGLYTLKFSKGFTLHTLILPKEKIAKIKIHQTLWQKLAGRSDLYFYTVTEGMRRYRCRNLDRKALEAFFEIL